MAGKTLAQTESIIKQIKPHITDDQPLSDCTDKVNVQIYIPRYLFVIKQLD